MPLQKHPKLWREQL